MKKPRMVDAVALKRDNVATFDPFASSSTDAGADDVPVRPGFKLRRAREMKPHASLYLHPRVMQKVREIAAARGCKAHDVYIEALRDHLRKQGYDFDALNQD